MLESEAGWRCMGLPAGVLPLLKSVHVASGAMRCLDATTLSHRPPWTGCQRQVATVVATEKVETGPVTRVGYHGSAASVVNLDTAVALLPAGERVARGFTRLYRSRSPGQRAGERRRPQN